MRQTCFSTRLQLSRCWRKSYRYRLSRCHDVQFSTVVVPARRRFCPGFTAPDCGPVVPLANRENGNIKRQPLGKPHSIPHMNVQNEQTLPKSI